MFAWQGPLLAHRFRASLAGNNTRGPPFLHQRPRTSAKIFFFSGCDCTGLGWIHRHRITEIVWSYSSCSSCSCIVIVVMVVMVVTVGAVVVVLIVLSRSTTQPYQVARCVEQHQHRHTIQPRLNHGTATTDTVVTRPY